MAGIVQDTHTFAHPNATARTLRVAAELVEAGAPLAAINRAVYADKPFSTLALWGLMLAGIEQRADGRIVFASMTVAMLASHRRAADRVGGVRRPAGLDALGRRHDPVQGGRARQRPGSASAPRARADAVAITSAFGGGGHPRAAGCTLAAPLEEARELVLAEAERELARGDARGR